MAREAYGSASLLSTRGANPARKTPIGIAAARDQRRRDPGEERIEEVQLPLARRLERAAIARWKTVRRTNDSDSRRA